MEDSKLCATRDKALKGLNNEKRFYSLRVFGLLSSSLLLFPQRFARYVLWNFWGVCRTREPSRNLELRPAGLIA